jgi:hypothetical protein
MMPERYVRPPLVPREATPAWLVVWRFRLVLALLIAMFVGLAVFTVQSLGLGVQDTGGRLDSPEPAQSADPTP